MSTDLPPAQADSLARALLALLAAAGHPTAAPLTTPLRLHDATLELELQLGPTTFTVDLAGWRHHFALADLNDDDASDTAALALDLVGAALFGALRIVVDRYDDLPRRFTLELADGDRWRPISTQGSRPWNPLARRTTHIHRGAAPRPPSLAPRPVTTLPWAPWAGACGFFGAPETAPPTTTELPINGELDLHNFHPREVKPLVLAYIDACLARGLGELRIVHGKGIGNLRRTVHAILDRHPRVTGYRLAGPGGGSWGATLVDLSPGPGHEEAH